MRKFFFAVTAAILLSSSMASAHPRCALAVFAPDPQEYGFGARHLASQMGIPYFFTHDLNEAIQQPIVVTTGAVDGKFMTEAVTGEMRQYVFSGGVLIVDDGESAGIDDLAGIAELKPSTHRYTMRIDASSGDPGFARLRFAEEQTLRLGNKTEGRAVLTQGYTLKKGTDARVLARFDDGTAALVGRQIGKGHVYVTGLAYYDAILRPQDGQAIDAGRVYDNGFEPSADVPQMIVRDWYLHYVAGAVVTDPTPDGLAGALILTHDVDYVRSVNNMSAYAKAEKAHGVHATYYVQAKTVRDNEDTGFFNEHAKAIVKTIFGEGADIASHSVAHAPDWQTFAVGSGNETPTSYRPFVKSIAADHKHGLTLGATLSGEIHVSQQRLDACASGIGVDAFRSGYLLINREQWMVLERYGYRYDSSYAAGAVMTSYPYVVMEEQGGSRESHILEFPIVIADAVNWVPMMPHMADFRHLLDKESQIHGVVTTLIHDDVIADKLAAELALADYARPAMWVGSIDAFGDFWNQRSRTAVETIVQNGDETVTVTSPDGISGLTLDFPGPVTVVRVSGTTATRALAPASGGASLVLGAVPAGRTVTLRVTVLKH
jgi:hypothetical protein